MNFRVVWTNCRKLNKIFSWFGSDKKFWVKLPIYFSLFIEIRDDLKLWQIINVANFKCSFFSTLSVLGDVKLSNYYWDKSNRKGPLTLEEIITLWGVQHLNLSIKVAVKRFNCNDNINSCSSVLAYIIPRLTHMLVKQR